MSAAMKSEQRPRADSDKTLTGNIFIENQESGTEKQAYNNNETLEPQRNIRGLKWVLVVLAVVSSTFLYAFDNTVMATVRPSILNTFRHVAFLPWMTVAYPFGEIGAIIIWGKLYGQINNKILYLVTLLTFEIGSALIGAAQSMDMLIVGRVVAGVGGSGTYVGTVGIISGMTTPTERAEYLNFVGMAWSLGTVLGPVIGGALADSAATWRWAFYLNLCIGALAGPICVFLIPSIPAPCQATVLDRVKCFDYIGAVLFMGGTLTIIMVLSFGGSVHLWDSHSMVVLYVLTPIIWVAFVAQQGWKIFTVDRIFPAHLIKSLTMVVMFAWTSIAISNLVITIYSLPLVLQFAHGDSSLRAAVFTLPFIAALVASAGAAGPLFPKYTVYMAWYAGCGVLMLIGGALLSTININTSRGAVCGFSVIQGLGCGPVIQLAFTVAQTKVPKKQISQVTAFLSSAQAGGICLALGISTCVFMNTSINDIAAILPQIPRDLVEALLNGAAGSSFLDTLNEAIRADVIAIIARNLGKLWYMNVAGAALGIVLAAFMKREKLQLEDTPQSEDVE